MTIVDLNFWYVVLNYHYAPKIFALMSLHKDSFLCVTDDFYFWVSDAAYYTTIGINVRDASLKQKYINIMFG